MAGEVLSYVQAQAKGQRDRLCTICKLPGHHYGGSMTKKKGFKSGKGSPAEDKQKQVKPDGWYIEGNVKEYWENGEIKWWIVESEK